MELPDPLMPTFHIDLEDDRTVISERPRGATEFTVLEEFPRRLTADETMAVIVGVHLRDGNEVLTVADILDESGSQPD